MIHLTGRVRRTLAAVAIAGAALPALGTVEAAGAQTQCGTAGTAAPSISVSPASIRADQTATVTVTGSRYLVPPHVCGSSLFGGVYLFFGWVAPGGTWGPSHRIGATWNGYFGHTYHYPGDSGGADTRDDGSGTIRLVSFTPGGTSGSETPFHMDAAGNWSTTLTIRGATYSYAFTDPTTQASETRSVDCRFVQCGLFTIGAHGLSSGSNEQFAPITFTAPPPGVTVPPPTAPPSRSAPSVAPSGATPTTAKKTTAPNAATKPGANAGAPATTIPSTTAPVAVAGESTVPETTAVGVTTTTGPDAEERTDGASERAAVQIFDDDDGGGGSAGLVVAGVGGAALLVGAGVWWVRRRRS